MHFSGLTVRSSLRTYCYMVNYFKPYKSGSLLCDIISNLIMIRFDNPVIYYGLVFDKKKYVYGYFFK